MPLTYCQAGWSVRPAYPRFLPADPTHGSPCLATPPQCTIRVRARRVFVPVPSQPSAADSGPRGSSSEGRLLARARGGSRSAVDALFARYGSWLRRWARGRLPAWARGTVDTSDLVQDTLHHTFARLGGFKSKQSRALRIYLRRAIENRIRDELRQVTRRREVALSSEPFVASDAAAPQHRQLLDDETWRRYLDGLERLSARERRLIVGRTELGYSFRQLALVERLSSPDAARMALQRALQRLGDATPELKRQS